MRTISVDEAKARFGPLIDPIAWTYRKFEDEQGTWRPEHTAEGVRNYRLFPKRPKVKLKRRKWLRPT
jgi:hypothetical protein